MGRLLDIWAGIDIATGEKHDPLGIDAEIASRKYTLVERLAGKPDRDRKALLEHRLAGACSRRDAKRGDALDHIARNVARAIRSILEYAAGYEEATHSGVSLSSWPGKRGEHGAEVLFEVLFRGHWSLDDAVASLVSGPDADGAAGRSQFDRRLREALAIYLYAVDAARPLACPGSADKDRISERVLRRDFERICEQTGADEMISALFAGVPLQMVAPDGLGGFWQPDFDHRSFNPIYVC